MALQSPQEIQRLFAAALECSFYISPTDPGLSYEELTEVGRQASLQPGEITDGINAVVTATFGRSKGRFLPNKGALPHWHLFMYPEEPEYRNIAAFQFIYTQLDDSRRANGMGNVRLERRMLLERATAVGLKKLDVEAAIAICLFTGQLLEKDGIITPAHPQAIYGSATAHLESLGNRSPIKHEGRRRAFPLVKDVIGRRMDGRPSAAEPFDALADELTRLGYEPFRLWWQQMAAELRVKDAQSSPASVTVLAAALVEGSLAFVVKHARTLNLGVMGSRTFDSSPTTWSIADLISSASAGGQAAILDNATRQRAESLIKTRQRIHAGRMLAEFPGGPPDLKPDQARDAVATAEVVVRKVIEWLEIYPPPAT